MFTPPENPNKLKVITLEEKQKSDMIEREKFMKHLREIQARQSEINCKAKTLLEEADAYLSRLDKGKDSDKKEGRHLERELSPEQQKALLKKLQARFKKNKKLHKGMDWMDVETALKENLKYLWPLQQLESTGGEPDVFMAEAGFFVFGDCSKESPAGRRNVVFNRDAEKFLAEIYPQKKINGNAKDRVKQWNVEFMNSEQYGFLKNKTLIDVDSYSWLQTPADVVQGGHALCANYYGYSSLTDHVENVCDYDDSIGFRCVLRIPKV